MTEQEFKSKISKAEAMWRLPDRRSYYEGYIRGLRRFYYGPHFGTLQEHEEWLGLVYDRNKSRADRGRGYQDGLQGIRPYVIIQ
jgi:hypothetical protein